MESSRTHRVVEKARRVHAQMAKLRARAVAEQRDYQVQLIDGQVIEIAQVSRVENVAADRVEDFGTDATATLNGDPNATITFSRTGRVNQGGTMVIDGGHSEHQIEIFATGMVRWGTSAEGSVGTADGGVDGTGTTGGDTGGTTGRDTGGSTGGDTGGTDSGCTSWWCSWLGW
jgi:hypothetical protein